MENKIKDIITRYSKDYQRQKDKYDGIVNSIIYCNQHNFKEEARILQVREQELSMPLYDLKNIIEELKELIKNNK
jgi:hypothetical protein